MTPDAPRPWSLVSSLGTAILAAARIRTVPFRPGGGCGGRTLGGWERDAAQLCIYQVGVASAAMDGVEEKRIGAHGTEVSRRAGGRKGGQRRDGGDAKDT